MRIVNNSKEKFIFWKVGFIVILLFSLNAEAEAGSSSKEESNYRYETFLGDSDKYKEDADFFYKKVSEELRKESPNYDDWEEKLKLRRDQILIDKFDLNYDGYGEIFVLKQSEVFCARIYKDCPITIYDKNHKEIFSAFAGGINILKTKTNSYHDIEVFWIDIPKFPDTKHAIYLWDGDKYRSKSS